MCWSFLLPVSENITEFQFLFFLFSLISMVFQVPHQLPFLNLRHVTSEISIRHASGQAHWSLGRTCALGVIRVEMPVFLLCQMGKTSYIGEVGLALVMSEDSHLLNRVASGYLQS